MAIASAPRAFCALRADGAAVAWGDPGSGGRGVEGLREVQAIRATARAFAAIQRDGSVVTWGHLGWKLKVFFPECVARVPVSLWGLHGGLGVWGWRCVRCSLDVVQPSATVRNRMAVPIGKFSRRGHFFRLRSV